MSLHPYVAEQHPIMRAVATGNQKRFEIKRIAAFALVRMQMVHLRPGSDVQLALRAQHDYEQAMQLLQESP